MVWLPFAIGSYFLSGLAAVIDKTILSGRLPNALIYTFYSGILSVFVLILAPFGFNVLPFKILIIALLSGISFVLFLLFFFRAVAENDVSRVASIVGAASSGLILLFSAAILKEFLGAGEITAFILFVFGGSILLFEKKEKLVFKSRVFSLSLLAAFFLSLSLIAAKFVFLNSEFINGFIWMRLGSFFFVFLFLLPAALRQKIIVSIKATKPRHGFLVVINKLVGAAGFIALNYAVSIGPVSLVNALKGIEYSFIFAMAMLVSFFSPGLFREAVDRQNIFYKFLGIAVIGAAFLFLR